MTVLIGYLPSVVCSSPYACGGESAGVTCRAGFGSNLDLQSLQLGQPSNPHLEEDEPEPHCSTEDTAPGWTVTASPAQAGPPGSRRVYL